MTIFCWRVSTCVGYCKRAVQVVSLDEIFVGTVGQLTIVSPPKHLLSPIVLSTSQRGFAADRQQATVACRVKTYSSELATTCMRSRKYEPLYSPRNGRGKM